MDFRFLIGQKSFSFARAHTRIYRSTLFLSFCLVFKTIPAIAQEPQFILGQDSRIHGVALDASKDLSTRQNMGISDTCSQIKKHATAMALVGSEGASVDPRIKSTRGIIVLEGLVNNSATKILHTAFLSPYKNYPASIPGEMGIQPGPRYPLAVTIAATVAGEGDLLLHKGDFLIIHADGQLFAYSLPEITIPSEGLLRLYLGTDDTLYYDSALTHPFHSSTCGGKQG